jgi:hypothetical protein
MLKRFSVWACLICVSCSAAEGAIITTGDGAGSDLQLRRNNNATESDIYLRITNKPLSGNTENNTGGDRIAVLNFDLSLLAIPVTSAALSLTTDLGASNQFQPGETLYLYGIPDGGPDENYTSTSFTEFDYSTGVNGAVNPRPVDDLTPNHVNDNLAQLLSTITFADATVAGQPIVFQSAQLTAFLASDTNGMASFILTVSQVGSSFTPVIASNENANQAPPTLLLNEHAPVPEPASALLGLGLAALLGRRACRGPRRRDLLSQCGTTPRATGN